MSSSKSMDSKPLEGGWWPIFLKSQFCFTPNWAPKNTDLSGQVAIITGATTGIGLVCARQMLDFKLSHLIIAVRSPKKGEGVAAEFRKKYSKATIEVWPLEMESYQSIQDFARRVEKGLSRINIAILNAGIMALNFEATPSTGHEKVIQVNYLSTVLLAILLLPIMKAKHPANSPGRLTIVNSGVSLASKYPWKGNRPLLPSFDDTSIMEWDPAERYWTSKLLGQLFFIKLFPYVSADDVVFNMVDPGYIRSTDLQREAGGILSVFFWLTKVITGRSLAAGASTYVDAAVVKGRESHGCFVMDWEIRP